MNSLSTNTNKESNLLTYLTKKLGSSNIIEDRPNRTYKINCNALCEAFPFVHLKEECNETYISVTKLLQVLEKLKEYNSKSNKTSPVAIILPLLYSTYGLTYIKKTNVIDYYSYIIYSKYKWPKVAEYEKINLEPARIAFKVSDMIQKNVDYEFADELITCFEVNFKDKTDKKFDVGIALKNVTTEDKFIILIEIQEKKGTNHDHSKNDQDKESIAHAKGLIIKYFFEDQITDSNYEINFYTDLLHTCYEVLIATSENFRNKNLLKETKRFSKIKIKELKKELEDVDEDTEFYELKNEYITELKVLINDIDNTTSQIQ